MASLASHRRPLLGLTYLVTVVLLMATSVAAYDKALPWQRTASVSLRTTQAGLGLNQQSDVKYQGLLVGEVRSIESDGTASTVRLALDRDLVGTIPADVDAMIVPKTLFGEKFVDLRRPADRPTDRHLADGDTIEQSQTSVELGEIFDRLVPVLETLQPARLSAVLSSLADALDGRGADIARSLRTTRTLLRQLSPAYGDLVADFRDLATTADVYADAAPDLIRTFSDAAAIARDNLVPHEQDLAALLRSATGTSRVTEEVLRTNRDRLVALSGRSRPVLRVLRTYAREVPCILRTLEAGNRLANLAAGVRQPYIGLSVDMVVDRDGYDYPKDLPSNPRAEANDENLPRGVPSWAPHCPRLPQRVLDLPESPLPYSQDPYGQTFRAPSASGGSASPSRTTGGRADAATVRSAREALARAIAAEQLGVPARRLPPYAELLMMPLLADGQVRLP
ncbi:MCE family protein [Nocardioides marmoribigeumensis]|uniref:Phospholipid/cholesterol/gamma-HCH transport system substrate-binding protein n=1 Tax=Nocardioides marmoribigeumensis TaxID=433649 RepID=A0ABU2BWT3_9ACTN|nr:MCE family protein [Nocardioides marmoribigeumensis]MDR7362563.1 phospholipid/cholesterol/gamma-HCH transport system substrate-binding protein [Nocardioides marmoribigeumensis]